MNIQKSNGPIIHLIPGLAASTCRLVAIIAMPKRKMLSGSGMAVHGAHTHRRKRTSEATWKNPIKWNAEAREFKEEHGHRPRVFCASLADVFDNQVPPEWREDLFALIRDCRRLDWLLLTKRPQNIRKMLPSDWGEGYRNVWLGVTAENQEWFDRRWKHLQDIPAVIKFISYEPALGPVTVAETWPFPGLAYFWRGKWQRSASDESPMGSGHH